MIPLDPDTRRRVLASARLLQSDKPGERQAALEAVARLLPSGTTIADLLEMALSPVVQFPTAGSLRSQPYATPEPVVPLRRWQHRALMLLSFPELLNERELAFASDMRVRRDEPTQKQWAWLNNLAARVEARAA